MSRTGSDIEDFVIADPKWRTIPLSCVPCNAPLYQAMCPVCHKDYMPPELALAIRIRHNCLGDEKREQYRDELEAMVFLASGGK